MNVALRHFSKRGFYFMKRIGLLKIKTGSSEMPVKSIVSKHASLMRKNKERILVENS